MSGANGSGLFFLDTNILIYAVDSSEREKSAQADSLVELALLSGRGLISTQVVQEFLNVMQRKFVRPMTVPDSRDYLQRVLLPLCQHFPTVSFYDHALSVQQQTGYSFYDSLIVTAALNLGCHYLYTEDMQHGRIVDDLTIINPFIDE